MPHLHLPVDHTDADLVLAANLADIVGSEDLYVVWSHESGPGAVPEVEAEMREPRATGPLAVLAAAFAAFWRALVGRPEDDLVRDDDSAGRARPEAERPYAD
jgi:hypothetical protein